MLEYLRDGRWLFQIPFLSILVAVWIQGPFSWITWALVLVVVVACGAAPTWMAAMTFMLFADICAVFKWIGNGIQKVVDVFQR